MGMGQEEVVVKVIAAEVVHHNNTRLAYSGCCACSSFCFCRLASFHFAPRDSGTHSSQLEIKNEKCILLWCDDIPPFLNCSRLAEEGGHNHVMHF